MLDRLLTASDVVTLQDHTVDSDGKPKYARVLALRGKKDWQTADRVALSSLYDTAGTAPSANST